MRIANLRCVLASGAYIFSPLPGIGVAQVGSTFDVQAPLREYLHYLIHTASKQMKPLSSLSAVLVLGLGLMGAANAAQQCFRSGGPTVYGAVTVTVSGCADYGFPFAPFVVNESQILNTGGTCTYTFSKPLVTSSVSVQVNSLDAIAALTISSSAGAYTSAAGDIGGPLAGSPATNTIVLSGAGYNGGAGVESSGTLTLTNSPPASITSISIAQPGGASGTLLKVCADDGGVASTAAAPIPTLSEWGTVLTAVLLAAVAAISHSRLNRRRNSRVS